MMNGMDTPLGTDPRLGNAPEDPASFLRMMIGTLYSRPQMYVRRLGELNSVLYFTHFLWAKLKVVVGRKSSKYRWRFSHLCGPPRIAP